MKIYSGKKFHTISVYERLSDLFQMKCFVTPKQWIDIQQCPNTKPMKGGHTHNHVDNQMEKLIVRKSARKRLRKLFKKKQSTNKLTKKEKYDIQKSKT